MIFGLKELTKGICQLQSGGWWLLNPPLIVVSNLPNRTIINLFFKLFLNKYLKLNFKQIRKRNTQSKIISHNFKQIRKKNTQSKIISHHNDLNQ